MTPAGMISWRRRLSQWARQPLFTGSGSSSSASGILSILLALSYWLCQTLHPQSVSALTIDSFNMSLQLLAILGIIQVSAASRKSGFPLLTSVLAISGSFGPSLQTSCLDGDGFPIELLFHTLRKPLVDFIEEFASNCFPCWRLEGSHHGEEGWMANNRKGRL